MKKIGLFSDTHGYLHAAVAGHFADCDEIWHAGDVGPVSLLQDLRNQLPPAKKDIPIRGVYGNIDGPDVRAVLPENNLFTIEGVHVFMRHIGGYPGKYAPGVRDQIKKQSSTLFISGHSHILKIMYDDALQCLHINPGAAGKQGWHQVLTLVTFVIDGHELKDCNVIELERRIG